MATLYCQHIKLLGTPHDSEELPPFGGTVASCFLWRYQPRKVCQKMTLPRHPFLEKYILYSSYFSISSEKHEGVALKCRFSRYPRIPVNSILGCHAHVAPRREEYSVPLNPLPRSPCPRNRFSTSQGGSRTKGYACFFSGRPSCIDGESVAVPLSFSLPNWAGSGRRVNVRIQIYR